jgi:hypothetical protein
VKQNGAELALENTEEKAINTVFIWLFALQAFLSAIPSPTIPQQNDRQKPVHHAYN